MWEKFWQVAVQPHVFFFYWKGSQNQSGFEPGDSCINHQSPVRYIQILWWWVGSKRCFSWHIKSVWQGLASRYDIKTKTKCTSSRNLLNVIEDFLLNRYQRVILDSHSSGWTAVNPGVPQSSILGSILVVFSLYQWLINWFIIKS